MTRHVTSWESPWDSRSLTVRETVWYCDSRGIHEYIPNTVRYVLYSCILYSCVHCKSHSFSLWVRQWGNVTQLTYIYVYIYIDMYVHTWYTWIHHFILEYITLHYLTTYSCIFKNLQSLTVWLGSGTHSPSLCDVPWDSSLSQSHISLVCGQINTFMYI